MCIRDSYKRFKPNTSEKKLVGIGQMATVAIVILGILLSLIHIYLPVLQQSATGGLSFGFAEVPINAMYLVLVGPVSYTHLQSSSPYY